ncbi:MAG: methyltransferase domain-containing protein [Bacteroidetes bacterium]|nr:methyltransferase domain-containing protein [Bacteroidota bacterium]
MKLPRHKKRNLLLSVIYRLHKIFFLSKNTKLKLYLNLEWIFDRLAHEMSFKVYAPDKHPFRIHSKKFILEFINENHSVLDLGCHIGDISFIIAQKAKKVIGIDYSKDAITKAKIKYQKDNLIFHHCEASEFLKNNKEHFDILILSHILEHLNNPEEFLLKYKNYFNHIYIEVPDFDRYYLNHYRKDLGLNLIYSDEDHISEFDRYELNKLLNHCGLKILKAEYIFGMQKIWCEVNKD